LARYTGPVCRICRREGEKLFLKGSRCLGTKCALEKRAYAPGVHGQRRTKLSNYGIQLREKQKVKRSYGLAERQFRNYFRKAERQDGRTGENLLRLLERRLDNVVYRSGFAVSRFESRQLVKHGHFLVAGRRVDIPSFLVKEGAVVEVVEASRDIVPVKRAMEAGSSRKMPAWLELDAGKCQSRVINFPSREDITENFNEQLIVELYSK